MKEPIVHIYSSMEALATEAAKLIKESIDALPPETCMTIALSGGTTPKKIYRYWSVHLRDTIPWNRIKLFWVDERCVPPDSDQSNYKMIWETLIGNVPLLPNQIFPLFGDREPKAEALRYSGEIEANVPLEQGIPCFDLILLGMGEDGHTASIFPDQSELFQTQERCVVSRHPQTQQSRLTLTGTLINRAKKVAFLVTGQSKAATVAKILDFPPDKTLPASWVQPTQGTLLWMLDKAAAEKIVC